MCILFLFETDDGDECEYPPEPVISLIYIVNFGKSSLLIY